MNDDELIEWFADLKLTDPVPAVPDPGAMMRGRVARLVDLGLMEKPDPTDLFVDVIRQARDACRQKLGR